MVHWGVSLQVKEEVIVEAHFPGLLLNTIRKHASLLEELGSRRGKLELLVPSQGQLWGVCSHIQIFHSFIDTVIVTGDI